MSRRGFRSGRFSDRDVRDARWGRGPAAGRTGDVFIDDPFFNPWAPGGDFNSAGSRTSRGSYGSDFEEAPAPQKAPVEQPPAPTPPRKDQFLPIVVTPNAFK